MSDAKVDTATLADKMKLSYQAVAKVLRGASKSFSAENNAKAAVILKVNPSWLASGVGSKQMITMNFDEIAEQAASAVQSRLIEEPTVAAAITKLRRAIDFVPDRQHAAALVSAYLADTTERYESLVRLCEMLGEPLPAKRKSA